MREFRNGGSNSIFGVDFLVQKKLDDQRKKVADLGEKLAVVRKHNTIYRDPTRLCAASAKVSTLSYRTRFIFYLIEQGIYTLCDQRCWFVDGTVLGWQRHLLRLATGRNPCRFWPKKSRTAGRPALLNQN